MMKCITCGANTKIDVTTDVKELIGCLLVVRNVPCHKCNECNEIIYTGDVVQQLEYIVNTAKQSINEIAVVDYKSAVA